MDITKTKKFERDAYTTKTEIPVAKGRESTYPFQWLLFKPQLHAVEPFVTNETSRHANTARSGEQPNRS